MKPSRESARHREAIAPPAVDAQTFRQGWRVVTRLDALHRDGRITAGEWQAAVAYRTAWERAGLEVSTTVQLIRASGPGGAGDAHSRLLAGLQNVTRLHATETAIGMLAADLCRCCIVHDLPWAETARLTHRHPNTVRDWTVLAIRALAGAWEHAGRRPGARGLSDSR